MDKFPDENSNDTEIGTLLDQLQNTNLLSKRNEKEKDPLKKEEVEKFVIEMAGDLIRESIGVMKSVKDYANSAPCPESFESLAGLITATSTAIETLNKLIVTDKKNNTSIKIKEMDIQSRKDNLITETAQKIELTREDVIKQLLSKMEKSISVSSIVTTVSSTEL